jgi:hypothetical protein
LDEDMCLAEVGSFSGNRGMKTKKEIREWGIEMIVIMIAVGNSL